MQRTRVIVTVLVLASASACGSTVALRTTAAAGTGPGGQVGAGSAVSSGQGLGGQPSALAGRSAQSGPAGTGPGASGPVVPVGRGPVGSRPVSGPTTAPIKVGFFVVDWTQAVSKVGGFSSSSAPPVIDIWKTWVAIVNATGGLAGRRVVPTYYSLDATAPDWSTDIQAACASFGEDNHVAFVASFANPADLLAQCLRPFGIPEVSASASIVDSRTLAELPNLFMPTQPRMERYTASVIRTAVTRGWLTPKDRVGVLLADCPQDTRTYADTVVPLAKQYGFAVEGAADIACPRGFAGAGGLASGTQNAVLSFRAHGVTQVMILAPTTNYVNVLFANDAHSQQWHPGYLLDSNALVQLSGSLIPHDQVVNMRGAGWVPVDDVQRVTSAAAPACVKLARAAGVQESRYMEEGVSGFYHTCDVMVFARQALQLSHGAASLGDLTEAARGLGDRFASSSDFGPTGFGAGQRDGAASTAAYAWATGCSCISYVGQPTPLPW